MAYKILVVKAEKEFATTLNALIAGYGNKFKMSYVAGRKEAMSELQTNAFDWIITALKIPRISDGYLFLSHVVKTLIHKKVIVVVEEKNDEVLRSINILGVKQLFPATNVGAVLQTILEDSGISDVSKESDIKDIGVSRLSSEKIKTALNKVMGPVGTLIFNDAAEEMDNSDDLNRLVHLIIREIGEEKKISLFRNHLNAQ